jgi:hypothetical protein
MKRDAASYKQLLTSSREEAYRFFCTGAPEVVCAFEGPARGPIHSGEVRHKIVGHEKVTLENKKFLTYYTIQEYYSISTRRLNIRKDI